MTQTFEILRFFSVDAKLDCFVMIMRLHSRKAALPKRKVLKFYISFTNNFVFEFNSPLHVGISLRSALKRTLSGSLSGTLADESWKSPPIEDKKYNWYIRWRHIRKIVLPKCSYISGNFDLIQGIRQILELARKIGLITMMKYQNFEKKFEK